MRRYQPARSQIITLRNGHTLSFDEHGPLDGFPILYFHGTPGSRFSWGFFDNGSLVEKLNLRVFSIDRPGIGHSSPQPARSLRDWAGDVQELLDALKLECVSIVAHSAGGAHALACAVFLPSRVRAVGLVAAFPEQFTSRLRTDTNLKALRFLQLFAEQPRLSRVMLRPAKPLMHYTPYIFERLFGTLLSPPDREVLQHPPMRQLLLQMLTEAFRQGTRATQVDGAVLFGRISSHSRRSPCPCTCGTVRQTRSFPLRLRVRFTSCFPTAPSPFFQTRVT